MARVWWGGRAAGARRTEKLLPFSARAVASPSGSAATEARMPTCSSAAMSSSARLAPAGSRFLRSAPANMTGSCGTTAAIARSSRSGMRSASTPPMRIAPPAAGTNRSSAAASDDLPEPVRPTMPTRSLCRSRQLTPSSTKGRPAR